MNALLNNNTIVIFWIVIMIVILLMIYDKYSNANNSGTEGFYSYPGYYKKYCGSCGIKSRFNCSKCTNCTFCIGPDGSGECVPGDSNGPYFREDCVASLYTEYGNPNDFYPYNNIFPTLSTYNMYPYYRWNLRNSPRFGYRKRYIRGKLGEMSKDNANLRRRLRNSEQ